MTNDEAIKKATEKLDSLCYLSETSTNPGLRKVYENMATWLSKVVYLAEIGLKAKQEQERNGPLTTDELREMDEEPVWISFTGSAIEREDGWFIIAETDRCEVLLKGKTFVYKSFEYYGKTWLAYRRKPEEGKE